MPWRSDALGRIVVIGDAAAHERNVEDALYSAQMFHRDGSLKAHQRQVSTVFTGGNMTGRRFYDRLALAGGGSFVDSQVRLLECVLLSVLPPRRS